MTEKFSRLNQLSRLDHFTVREIFGRRKERPRRPTSDVAGAVEKPDEDIDAGDRPRPHVAEGALHLRTGDQAAIIYHGDKR